MTTIGVLGSGVVGQTLADGFLKHGYDVMRGSREPKKLADWKAKSGSRAQTGTFDEATRFGEVIVLAVKGSAALEVVHAIGPDALAGRIVLDATNPIADGPPTNGVIAYATDLKLSLMEKLQQAAPKARFVKCFSSVGNALMVNPALGQRPSMFICGNDAEAKRRATDILDQFGWDTEDCGAVEAARAIEPLCILWCIPGFLRNDWMHAFKVLRK